MALTTKKANDAIQELIDEGKLTEESLKDIINQLDTYAGDGKKTILYSGMGEDFSKSLSNNPDIRIIE